MARQAATLTEPVEIPTPPASPRPYDCEMIGDFLHQLLWELRVDHNDWADDAERGLANRTSDRRLAPYIGRHGAVLLPVVVVKGEDPLTPEQEQLFRSRMRAIRQRQIDALEMLLEELIPDVLRCASQSSEGGAAPAPIVEMDARGLLVSDTSAETAGS